jgi:protein-disulfide isomerase
MPSSTSRVRDREQQEQADLRRAERRRLALLALVLVVLLVGGGTGFQLWRTSRSPVLAPVTASTLAPVPVQPGRPILLGQPQAPARLTLYEDFHCSHCADFEESLGPAIRKSMSSGLLAVELYPMSFLDQGSRRAANAMACATEAGFGPAYYAGLFANHTLQWSDQQLLELAGLVSTVVPAAFGGCVQQGARLSWVDSINAAAAVDGITATPTVQLDGRTLDWNGLTPDGLSRLVEEAAVR